MSHQLPSTVKNCENVLIINKTNKSRKELKQLKDLEEKHLPKLEEYGQKPETSGERNSYSKTDEDATFMRMKEDPMRNGQLQVNHHYGNTNEKQKNF